MQDTRRFLSNRGQRPGWIALLLGIVCLGLVSCSSAVSAQISYVKTSGLASGDQFHLEVNGMPFLPIEIQLRLDKLRYDSTYEWSWADCEALVGQAAAAGFNTVAIPVMWYEVEPTENNFDWTVLDNYLTYVNAYNLKMEMLWFGTNSGGTVQWLGNEANPVHLRVPDYVLYSPSYGSTATTSDYEIDRNHSPYTLVDTDSALMAREQYVLGQVMAHIASWDAANGNKHPVIGVQIENEMNGGDYNTAADVINYINGVAAAVKSSSYVVWTRTNNAGSTNLSSRINENETLRSSPSGTNLDFIGIDDYSSSLTRIEADMPYIGKNFREIMEADGQDGFGVRLAAMAGGESFNTYDMCGPDTINGVNNGLYYQTANNSGTCVPDGSWVTSTIIPNNKMLGADPVDLALYAPGSNAYYYNWQQNSTSTTSGTSLSISYTPASTTDVGISIIRSSTHIILMSTGGGTFTLPSSVSISSATSGYFNSSNSAWISTGDVSYANNEITPGSYVAVEVTYTNQ